MKISIAFVIIHFVLFANVVVYSQVRGLTNKSDSKINSSLFGNRFEILPNHKNKNNSGALLTNNLNLAKNSNKQISAFRPQEAIVDDSIKITYTYDTDGNLLSQLNQKMINDEWIYSSRNSNSYDSKGCKLSELYENWISYEWVNSKKITRKFDDKGNEIFHLQEEWINNSWLNIDRFSSTFDINGNMLTYLFETWMNNEWVAEFRFIFTYDSFGNILTGIDEYWSNNAWGNAWRTTQTFAGNGYILSRTDEVKVNDSWENMNKYLYTYDNNWNYQTLTALKGEKNTWVNYSKSNFNCDINGNILTELNQKWADTWIDSSFSTYTYNNTRDVLSELLQKWINNTWVNEYRRFTTYNNRDIKTDIKENWVNNGWQNATKYSYEFDNNGNAVYGVYFVGNNNTWSPANGYFSFFYNDFHESMLLYGHAVNIKYTPVTDVKGNNIVIKSHELKQNFPNPFNPATNISFTIPRESFVTLKIYDALGRELSLLVNEKLTAGTYSKQWNAIGLPSGVYFYKLKADGYTETKKMNLLK